MVYPVSTVRGLFLERNRIRSGRYGRKRQAGGSIVSKMALTPYRFLGKMVKKDKKELEKDRKKLEKHSLALRGTIAAKKQQESGVKQRGRGLIDERLKPYIAGKMVDRTVRSQLKTLKREYPEHVEFVDAVDKFSKKIKLGDKVKAHMRKSAVKKKKERKRLKIVTKDGRRAYALPR